MDPDVAPLLQTTVLAEGEGWRALEVVCDCSPQHGASQEEAHEAPVVAAVLSGVFAYQSGRTRTLLSPGSLLLGELNRCYSCSHPVPGGDRCVAFRCEPDFVEDIAADLKGVRSIGFPRPRLAPQKSIAPLLAASSALTSAAGVVSGEEVAVAMFGAALRYAHDGEETRVSPRDEARVADAVAQIDQNPALSLSLAALAREARVTRHHFLRIFRKVTGITPYAYVIARRLQLAASRLAGGDRSTLDVALDSGFSDLSEFTGQFRRAFGRTPGRYRRERSKRNAGNERSGVTWAFTEPTGNRNR